MIRYILSTFLVLVVFSLAAVAQDKDPVIYIKGQVVKIDANVPQGDTKAVTFNSVAGSTYYLIADKDEAAALENLKKHPKEPVKISGSIEDKDGVKYFIVKSVIFL